MRLKPNTLCEIIFSFYLTKFVFKLFIMAQIAGIATTKNTRGEITHVTFNLKKHPQVMPFLIEIGVISKTSFENECENALSVEEARAQTIEFVKFLPWKK